VPPKENASKKQKAPSGTQKTVPNQRINALSTVGKKKKPK
jgi:hypothetical protein